MIESTEAYCLSSPLGNTNKYSRKLISKFINNYKLKCLIIAIYNLCLFKIYNRTKKIIICRNLSITSIIQSFHLPTAHEFIQLIY